MKTPDRNDLKLGTVAVLDSLSKHIDFGLKRSRVGRTGSSFRTFGILFMSVEQMQVQSSNFALWLAIACGSKITPECGGCHRI